ncbi:hypothetical protein D7Y13_36655 [Corallococcus praedator]|uniref:Uncharacterized protein n=1 Tax=Corallococcus praedator TaxID=2316724 RepID=A0ABX9Q6E6_9BACT|nr:hypothetical protein D7X75_39435 [Corallococcus sp. CA031C]RKH92456.1 hypothetical protein D7Y13_36655 [Corallococcus praedator]
MREERGSSRHDILRRGILLRLDGLIQCRKASVESGVLRKGLRHDCTQKTFDACESTLARQIEHLQIKQRGAEIELELLGG